MIQSQINKAYPALQRLSELTLPIKKAKELYMLTKRIEDHFQFAVRTEREYIKKFDGKYRPDGTINFETVQQYDDFNKKMSELNELEVKWDSAPVIITESDMGLQRISPSDICSLEGFVSFE